MDRINNTFRRADQIQWASGIEPNDPRYVDYFLPIVADAEAGFGGVLNAFELMKSMIEAGAAAVHFEDQLASVKKCGHMGGKVLVPTQEAIQKLVAARLAADVMGVPTLVIARTDADAADLITSDCDPYDSGFITGERTSEGFTAPMRALSRRSAAVWRMPRMPIWYGAKLLRRISNWRVVLPMLSTRSIRANCWPITVRHPSTGRRIWTTRPLPASSSSCRTWVTNTSLLPRRASTACGSTCSTPAHAYAQGEGMKHYVEKVQQPEFAAAKDGYTFVSHQQEVGTGYFDKVTTIIQGGASSVTALTGSTEESQF